MKQFVEFIPMMFFTAIFFFTRDIFVATMVLLVGVCIQVCIEYVSTKAISKQTKVVFGVTILLGGSTVLFRNEEFLFWKPTVVNWIFTLILLGFHFLSRENPLKKMMGSKLHLPDVVWKNLTLGWSAGFFIAGLLNLIVAYNFSLDAWVSYKLFGGIIITLAYFFIMMIYLWKGGFIKGRNAG